MNLHEEHAELLGVSLRRLSLEGYYYHHVAKNWSLLERHVDVNGAFHFLNHIFLISSTVSSLKWFFTNYSFLSARTAEQIRHEFSDKDFKTFFLLQMWGNCQALQWHHDCCLNYTACVQSDTSWDGILKLICVSCDSSSQNETRGSW